MSALLGTLAAVVGLLVGLAYMRLLVPLPRRVAIATTAVFVVALLSAYWWLFTAGDAIESSWWRWAAVGLPLGISSGALYLVLHPKDPSGSGVSAR